MNNIIHKTTKNTTTKHKATHTHTQTNKQTTKQNVSNDAESMGSQRSPESAQCVFRIVNTICLVRSKGLHFGDFWPHFGSLSG